MANKNRGARAQDFKQGRTMYLAYFGELQVVHILGRPYNRGGGSIMSAVDVMKVDYKGRYERDTLFLGDRGVPGFAYDQRPNEIFLSRGACERNLERIKEYRDELCTRISNDMPLSWMDYPDYDDWHEPSPDEQVRNVLSRMASVGTREGYLHEVPERLYENFTMSDHSTTYVCRKLESDCIAIDYKRDDATGDCKDVHEFYTLQKGMWRRILEGRFHDRKSPTASKDFCKFPVAHEINELLKGLVTYAMERN
ncbi:hypothetical protein [Achromobacter phage Motura]|uniref:Uncharacterized protein n=1 Tax=Achromobacter phage Motura TaxID=2591403 RepID=A0A514CSQ5_9CAUD|nr:hypothetical protein H1O15_gp304 [Achromobacter phage Motura]QDH83502.1 hypothetical protein [Achromobacter phage Motura]